MSVLASSFTKRRLSLLEERYADIEEIGFGGMGRVYKAFDKFLLKNVAIKVLTSSLASDNQLVRFQNEAKLASKLSHPNIVKVFDFGVASDNDLYMVMDFVNGESLQFYIDNGCLSLDDVILITLEICEALHHAHYNGIIHRDIKPNNIMLEESDNGYLVAKLVDFGVAKESSQRIQYVSSGKTILSPLYSSPEQINSEKLDHRTDIYSLGCVIYSMISGKPPYEGENALNTMDMHVNSSAPSIGCSEIDPTALIEIERVIQKAISKSPEDRYQTISELKQDLLSIRNSDDAEQTIDQSPDSGLDFVNTHFIDSSKRLMVVLCALVITTSLFFISWISKQYLPSKKLPIIPSGIVSIDTIPDGEFVIYNYSGKITWLGSGITNDQDFKSLKDKSFSTLELHASDITGSGLEYVQYKPIHRLAIQGCKIEDENLAYIGTLGKLTSLDIVFSTVSDRGIEKISKLPSLTSLNLKGCKAITNDAIPLIKKRFPNLRCLDIGNTGIDGQGLRQLKGFKRLVKLSMDGVILSDRDILRYVADKPYVQIGISNNVLLTDRTLEYLGRMPTLKVLKIDSTNKFSPAGIDNFKAMNPGCSVQLKSTGSILKQKKFASLFESVVSNGIGVSR